MTQDRQAWQNLKSLLGRIFPDLTSSSLVLRSFIGWCLILIYIFRPDGLAALTIFPSWAWLILLIPVFPFFRKEYLCHKIVLLGIILVYCVLHVEEPIHLVRGMLIPPQSHKPARAIRIVTHNCLGQSAALEEVRGLEPDLIFLQESPPLENVKAFAQQLGATSCLFLYDFDTSIVAQGDNLDRIDVDKSLTYCSLGTLSSPFFGRIQLVSLRLQTSMPRLDLWNPDCWREQKRTRRTQRKQINEILEHLDDSMLAIVGGDFNAPQGDPVFIPLKGRLYDTFGAKGRGNGNTILNDVPVLRIDQIWVSQRFQTLQSFVVKSRISDHRIVVSDIALRN